MYDSSAVEYRKSSFSGWNGCVEVAPLPGDAIALRDSKNPNLPPHVFTAGEWDAFVAGVKSGEFDRSALSKT